ncbi:hypothetical protein [Mammaliicoccus sp. H-M33]|uniref:hypothetical protein n=1 Tax=Mammaliicoccus sp. H-M33 TaxID=2898692 RepID=UPI001EFA5691|nr:hypothetical protein [Mammaliicoccus sp. H-M33]
MEDKPNKVLKLHFVYMTIILTLVIIVLISIISYQKDTAWLLIGFIGTGISLVLSVLAIFVTFIDMTGQQKKLSDITDTANELKFSLTQFIKESQKFYDNVKSIESSDNNENNEKDKDNNATGNQNGAFYSKPVGFVSKFKVKKYDITADEIRSYAKATNIKVRIDEKKEIHFYNVEYFGKYDEGADSRKFKRLIREKATIID